MARKVKKISRVSIGDEAGVAEVRRWRAKLWVQGGRSLKGVIALLQASQNEREAAGEITVVRKRPTPKSPVRKRRPAA